MEFEKKPCPLAMTPALSWRQKQTKRVKCREHPKSSYQNLVQTGACRPRSKLPTLEGVERVLSTSKKKK
jgi:hypothetical protein